MGIIGSCLTLVPSNYFLIAGRCFHGLAISAQTILLKYINEALPREYRGHGATCVALAFGFGVVGSFSMGINIDEYDDWWRVMLGFPIALCLIQIVFFCFVFNDDTPDSHYARTGNKE